jgi:alpha-galactosidase
MLPTKITIIGAGSASFGINTLASLIRSPKMLGSHLALVDLNTKALDIMTRFANYLNQEWNAQMTISAHSHYRDALEATQFVVLSIETSPREALWKQDFQIPLKYGVRQPYAENGGPGGFAHAARNIYPAIDIVRHMERICPDAWLINFTNPMMRICDAVARYSSIKVVGLCHQILVGYASVGKVLAKDLGIHVPEGFTSTSATPSLFSIKRYVARQALDLFDITAAGLNHFSWMLSIRSKQTDENLYPLFRDRWRDFDPTFEPLTRRIFETFGLFPIAGDEHFSEYLPWVSDPQTKPWEKFDLNLYEWDRWEKSRADSYIEIEQFITKGLPIDQLRDSESEGAIEIIENIAGNKDYSSMAVNLPNQGYIPNLPSGAIVEVPATVNGSGVHGIILGDLPEPIAELCRREITTTRLCVDAAITGDRQTALQCLLLDPVITDLDVAKLILDDYLQTYREFLPQFWK